MSKKDDDRGAGRSDSGRDENGRFLPGESGNRLGRPRKRREDEFDLRGNLMEPIKIQLRDGRYKKMPYLYVHLAKLKERALGGDNIATREINKIIDKIGFYDDSQRMQVDQYNAQIDSNKLRALLNEEARRQKEKGEAED
jgi:hypothetical protein